MSDSYAARGEPRAVVPGDRLGEDGGVLARRREAPRALRLGHLAVIGRDRRVAGAVARLEIAEHRGEPGRHARRYAVIDRAQPVEQVPAEVAVADLVAEDPIEGGARGRLRAGLAQVAE